jgi:hypothetical protein
MVTQAIPLHPPVATLGPGAVDFGENSQLLSFGGFWQVWADFGRFGDYADFPKTHIFVITLKLMI